MSIAPIWSLAYTPKAQKDGGYWRGTHRWRARYGYRDKPIWRWVWL